MTDLPELAVVYRVQDDEGRGPWRPGFSHVWCDDCQRDYLPPAIFEDFGWDLIARMRDSGLHCGTAVRSVEQIREWFSRAELRRLKRLGYRVVSVRPDRVFAESEHQIVFGCREHLSEVAQEFVR